MSARKCLNLGLTLLLISSASLTATAHPAPQQHRLVRLLQQTTPKLQKCAKMGYPAYQNALSASYLSGRKDLSQNKIKALAWAIVVLKQVKPTAKLAILEKQRRYIRYISTPLTNQQIRKAQYLADTYKKIYGQHWPKPPVLSLKHFNHECVLQ